jgi:predicted MPP superfamily phosphohydrolase
MSLFSKIIFFTVIFSVFFGLQYLVFSTFRKFVRNKFKDKSFRNAVSVYPFIIFNLPFLLIIANGFSNNNLPQWLYNIVFPPFYIFQGAVFFIGVFLLSGKIIKSPFSLSIWILNKFEYSRNSLNKFFNKPPVKKINYSRRAFIKTSTAFVSGYAFIGATMGVIDRDDYEIVFKNIKIDNLPDEIKGTTITMISDIHSGPYMKEFAMKEYADIINDLKSDFIMIPGDLTNSVKTESLTFASAFKNLEAPRGIFASLGNHDYFSDPDYISKIISNETPVKLLRNNCEIININGKDLCILGVEDTRQSGSASDPVLMGYLDSAIEISKSKAAKVSLDYDNLPKIALFHKPYFMEQMQDKKLDLILSGHTHGGQVVIAKYGNLNISFAGAVSKYISGLYETGSSKMYVSRGLGCVGLPIRFNCKPEITKITLI